MDYQAITARYYENWLGREGALSGSGVEMIDSEERNQIQEGYGRKFDLYVLIKNGKIAASFGDALRDRAESIGRALRAEMTAEEAAQALEEALGRQVFHGIKYVYAGCGKQPVCARPLNRQEYPIYRDFFVRANPDCKNIDWLEEYFEEMAAEGLCCAYLLGGEAVSCTDAPSMPYMAEYVQEIGINTLPGFRGQGYAADACLAAAMEIVMRGKCPVWSTDADNIASRRLAEKVGFVYFADCLTATL